MDGRRPACAGAQNPAYRPTRPPPAAHLRLPPSPLDPGICTGTIEPAGSYFDPPRNYGT
jgi:hypothetical protein